MAVPGDAFFEAGLELNLSDKMTSELGEAQTKAQTFSTRMQQTADRIDSAGKRAVSAGRQFGMAGAAMLTPLAGATAHAVRFDNALIELQKRTDEQTAQDLAAPIEELSTELPLASTKLLKLADDAARFGIRGQENILAFTETVSKLGISTDLSVDMAGKAFAKLATMTDTPITEIEGMGSAINSLSNDFATSTAEITDSMLRSSQALSNLGLRGQEITAINAVMNQASESAERAGSRLARFASALQTPEKQRRVANAIGMTASRLSTLQENAPMEMLQMLSERFAEGGETADRLRSVLGQTSQKAIAALASDTEALTGALKTSSTQFREQSSLTREVNIEMEKLTSQATLMWNQILKIARSVGQELLPHLRTAAVRTREWLDGISGFVDRNAGFVSWVTMTTAAIGGLLVTVGGALATFGFLAQGVGAALSAFASLSAFFSGGVLMSGITTVGSALGSLTAGVIGPLILAAGAIIKFWRPLAAFFKGLFTGVFDALRPLVGEFDALMTSMRPVVGLAFELLSPVGDNINQFERWIAVGKTVGSVLTTFIVSPLRLVIATVRGVADGFMVLVDHVNQALSLIEQGNWFEAGGKIIKGLIEGIFAMQGELFDTVSNIAGEVRSYLPFSPAEKGPLSDLDKTGPAFINTIAEGMGSSPLMDAFGMPSRAGGRPPQRRRGSQTIEFNAEVHIHGDADAEDVRRGVEKGGDRVVRKVKREMEEENRTRF